MIQRPELRALVGVFLDDYDQSSSAAVWAAKSEEFRQFWTTRVMAEDDRPISEGDCDKIIRILDRSGKGNTRNSEAIAKCMVPQGAWRRLFNELRLQKPIAQAVNRALLSTDPKGRALAIGDVYRLNGSRRNYLTGDSGNAICTLLAGFDPSKNLSMVSLNDRRAVLDYLGIELQLEGQTHEDAIGSAIVLSNSAILNAAAELRLPPSARTISAFFYHPEVKPLWKPHHTVKLPGRALEVSIPAALEEEEPKPPGDTEDGVRESMQIQALLAKIGATMGFRIWLPRNDRSRVLKAWSPQDGELLESLPLAFDSATLATIEQIDVLWLKRRSIVRAFEVEHTTSIYSGLLRMADLIALQPNLKVKLHIVAGAERRDKVLREIRRPVFSMMEECVLRDLCTFLSYDKVRELGELKHLAHTSDAVLGAYEESANKGEEDS